MLERGIRRHAASWCALDEPFLYQARFVNVFDGVRRFVQGRGQRLIRASAPCDLFRFATDDNFIDVGANLNVPMSIRRRDGVIVALVADKRQRACLRVCLVADVIGKRRQCYGVPCLVRTARRWSPYGREGGALRAFFVDVGA